MWRLDIWFTSKHWNSIRLTIFFKCFLNVMIGREFKFWRVKRESSLMLLWFFIGFEHFFCVVLRLYIIRQGFWYWVVALAFVIIYFPFFPFMRLPRIGTLGFCYFCLFWCVIHHFWQHLSTLWWFTSFWVLFLFYLTDNYIIAQNLYILSVHTVCRTRLVYT